MRRAFHLVVTLTLGVSLVGCGAAYISPDVPQDDPNVDVVPLTPDTIRSANKSVYTPKKLPKEFYVTAGSGGQIRGSGALPEPSGDAQRKPSALPRRLPPDAPLVPYRIGVGDVVLLATSTAGDTIEELSGLLAAQNRRQGYTVQDDGAIAIADVGRVMLGGLTLEEAQDEVFRALVSKQIDPSFSLEITQFNSQRVSVGGAVEKPTIVPITLRSLTLEEALASAEGMKVLDEDYVSIRIYRDGELYQIPLKDFLGNADVQKTRLAPGDSVFVDTEFQLDRAESYFREQISLAQLRAQNRAQAISELETELSLRRAQLAEARENFNDRLAADAIDRDYVYIAGEVNKPGRFPLPFARKASLADALFSEGGLSNQTSNPTQVYVLRGQSGSPKVTAYNLDYQNAANLVMATKFELRPDDIIFAAEQPITRWGRVVTQLGATVISSSAAAARN